MFSDGYGYLQNSSGGPNSAVNQKYRKKYNKIKRIIKDLVFVSTINIMHCAVVRTRS